MASSTNLSHFIEKKICRELIHGAYDESGRIKTDNDNGGCHFENIFTGPILNDTTENKEAISEVSDLTKRKRNEDKNGLYMYNENANGIAGQDDKTADRTSNTMIDTRDEVDYFDSDEEYLETRGLRFDEIDDPDEYGKYFRPLDSRGGRYSKGIDQVENLPVYRRSIQEFAKANNFEICDMVPDGNCMFQALSDQFMIHGRLGYTAERLRSASIEYLRKYPYKEDGQHIQSFLCKENWEDYLERMSRTKEWGDHIILQALVDAFNLSITIFNVFDDDVRHTILQPKADTKHKQMQAFLGHIGEFHYLSLRPGSWTKLWPYRSLIFRTLASLHPITASTKQEIIRKKISDFEASEFLTEDEFADIIDFHRDNPCISSLSTGSKINDRDELYFETYALDEMKLQETEEAPLHIVLDPLHIDVQTGIPLPHLSYIFKTLVPPRMIFHHAVVSSSPLIFSNIVAYFVGTKTAGFDVHLIDISKSQKEQIYYRESRSHGYIAAIIHQDKIVHHQQHHHGYLQSRFSLITDSSKTHAGYCHVRVLFYDAATEELNIAQRRNEKYLKEIKVSDVDILPPNVMKTYEGLKCETFPPEAQEWLDRKRKYSFPSRRLFQTILQCGFALIKKAHPNSKDPDIEWKYEFSLLNQTILTTGLSEEQQYGFWVFKILIENMSSNLKRKLKIKHLIAVYFRVLEEIPNEMWETNFSGCILFAVSSMVACLKARCLPHYFITSNNLIDSFSVKEINEICINVECIRMFPLFVLQVTAEKHGYTFAQKLIKMVFQDCRSFQHNKDLMTLFTDAFIPGTLGVMKVFTRIGFYDSAFQQLIDLHKQMLLVKTPADCNGIPDFLEIFEIAVRSFRQKSTRVILSMLSEKYFKTDVLCKVIDKRSIFVKDILPWKTSEEIEWMEIPSEKVSDLSTLAEYFFSCGIKECDKRNKTLATATLETAITCLQKSIQVDTICPSKIEDKILKEEVLSQRRNILLKFKRRLMLYYTYIWCVSELYTTVDPLNGHIHDIEKLCVDLPDMTAILIKMFRHVRMEDKALEYEKRLI